MQHKTANTLRKTGRILMVAFTLLFATGFAAGSMLEANVDQVNNFLGTRTTKTTGGGSYDSFTPDDKYLNSDGTANTAALVEAHKEMGIRLAEEGSVLLKNENNALPLSTSSEKVTLMGYRSTASYACYGMDIGSPEAEAQNVSFRTALSDYAGFSLNSTICDAYETVSANYGSGSMKGMSYAITELGTSYQYTVKEPTISEIQAQAGATAFSESVSNYNDVAIVVVGRPSSEQADYFTGETGADPDAFNDSTTKSPLSLSDNERDLIKYAKENFKKVVVVITTASAMEIDELAEDKATSELGVDAILWAGYPGNYGFIGIANVLAGKANPSGRLSDTYASDSAASPAAQNMGLNLYSNALTWTDSNGNTLGDTSGYYYAGSYVVEAEGIYVGYKYYETRYEDSVLNQGNASSSAGVGAYNSTTTWNYADEMTYTFGYGLSYTTYTQKITDVNFSADSKTAYVTVSVENTGSVDGQSVIQLYGQSPYTDYDKQYNVEKASVQLLAYDKIEVAANTTETVTIEVDMQNFASYDSEGAKSYIMEQTTAGGSEHYYFALGCNPNDNTEGAHAAVNNILAAKGCTPDTNTKMDAVGYSAAVYQFDWSEAENTFATSKAGETVTNQLSDMDINNYISGTVTYLSRSNWSGTWPSSIKGLTATDEMIEYLTNSYYDVSTTDDVSGITFGATYSDDEDVNFTDMFGSDFEDSRWDTVISQISLEDAVRYTASGDRSFQELDSIYFLSSGSYTENGSVGIQKTLSQQSDENAPWYVSTDDENATYYCNSFGSAPLMASTWNQDLLYEMGELWGNDALFINIPMVWAPSINIHRTPYNGRNGEYYSEDGVLSGYSALRVGQGALSKGLITAVKHFAFNSQETTRMGLSTFMTEQAARENELRGFQIALEGDYSDSGERSSVIGIMTAYNRVGVTYSGGHTGLMQNILRGEWDYNGYVTSDKLNTTGGASTYMPYIEGIVAGTTNYDVSISNDNTIWRISVSDMVASIQKDATVLTALQEDLHYSLWAFSQSNLANWMTDTTQVVWTWNWWRVAYYGAEILGGAGVAAGLVMYVVAECLGGRKKREEV